MAVIPNLSADRRIAAVIRRLELDVNRRLDGVLHGDYLGLVPGEGSDLGECRQYAPGDDVRRIDWNVSARNSATYVRETIADRELESWLIVDQSPSLQFGTSQWEKRDVALAVATGMGVLTSRGGNRIGAIVGVGSTNQVMPPRQGRTHLLAILHQIAEPHPASTSGPTLIPLLERANAICKRRGSRTSLSDWKEPIEQWRP